MGAALRLSADELQRMRLNTVDALFDRDRPAKAMVATPATSLATSGPARRQARLSFRYSVRLHRY